MIEPKKIHKILNNIKIIVIKSKSFFVTPIIIERIIKYRIDKTSPINHPFLLILNPTYNEIIKMIIWP